MNSVSIREEFDGVFYRASFANSPSGRATIAETYRDLADEIMEVWGDEATMRDGIPVAHPQPADQLQAAQIQAIADRNEFLEDCITEMAGIIYAS